MHSERDAIHKAVRDLNRMNGERANAEAVTRVYFAEVYLVQQFMLFELVFHIGEGEFCSPDRDLEFRQDPGKGADVVFVAMGEHDGANPLAIFLQVRDIGNNDIHAQQLGFREHQAGVDDNDVVTPAHGLHISSFNGVVSVEVGALDNVAGDIVRGAMKVAAVEGAGLGVAGLITIIPDLSILAAITLRTVQKLSLLYGFEYNTDDEIAELWVAAASAAGVDISRELLEKEVVNRFVPRVIQRIAAQASGEVVEKWAGRLIPLASSVLGAGLNYYFVRAWGQRAQSHFRGKHLAVRRQLSAAQASVTTDDPPLLSS